MAMELTKTPPPDIGPARPEAAAVPRRETAAPTNAPPSPMGDRVDIQPLDVPAALQILIAEVRAELQLPVAAPRAQSAAQTAQIVLQLVLQAADATGPDATGAVPIVLETIDAAVQSALGRAVAAVSAWRNVPPAVVDSAHEARGLIATALNDEPPSALWCRPEWEWLAPRIQHYWRRRRQSRRDVCRPGLTDPDLSQPYAAADDRADPPPVE
jgi:hypothetical protein